MEGAAKEEPVLEVTFEAEFRENLNELSKLGKKIVADLLYYDKEYWCKVYFNCEVKCDAVDNNMCESFNAWILAVRHKTIITMLEEIRVKVMSRLARLSEFPNSWVNNFSPMAMKVLEDNITKSMRCNIEFNGVTGYEVLDGYKQHTVCLRKRKCSCRSWILKGIPCPHALAAMLYKQYDPLDFIDPCYSKERYLMTYSHFMQPLNNMPMWPESTNTIVAPPVIKKMPGRPKKLRRKEAGETKKSGKLPKTGVSMTCSLCHVKGHNRRGCHLQRSDGVGSIPRESSTAPNPRESSVAPNPFAAEPSSSRKARGRPKKPTSNEGELVEKRGRGRPKKSIVPGSTSNATVDGPYNTRPATNASPSKKRQSAPVSADFELTSTHHGLGSWFECSEPNTRSRAASTSANPSNATGIPSRGARLSSTTGSTRGRERGRGSCSQGSTLYDVPNTTAVPKETAATRGRGKGVGNTTQCKRPRVTGMGVFQAENVFNTFNPGLPSRRILSTGPKKVLKSAVVTGDIGFKPTSGLKWKGNQAITTRKLQQIRDQSRPSNKLSLNASSSSQPKDPWKL